MASRDPLAGLSEGQKAYEARRAAKAGMSLEKWMVAKEKQARAGAKASAATAPKITAPARKPGLISRLFGRGKAKA